MADDGAVLRIVIQEDGSTVNGAGASASSQQAQPSGNVAATPATPRASLGLPSSMVGQAITPVWVANMPRSGVVGAGVTAGQSQPYPLARRKPRAAQARARRPRIAGRRFQTAAGASKFASVTAVASAALEAFTVAVQASATAIRFEATQFRLREQGQYYAEQAAKLESQQHVAGSIRNVAGIGAGLATVATGAAAAAGVSGATGIGLPVAAVFAIVSAVAATVSAVLGREKAKLDTTIDQQRVTVETAQRLSAYSPDVAQAQARYQVSEQMRDFRQAQYEGPQLSRLLELQNTQANLERAVQSIRAGEQQRELGKKIEEHIQELRRVLHDEAAKEEQRIKAEAQEKMGQARTQAEALKIQKDMLDQLKRLHDLEQEKNTRGTIDEVLKGITLPDLSGQVDAHERQRDHWRNDHMDIPILLTGR